MGRDKFIHALPKVELHVHIEGTLSPELRWKLAERNGMVVRSDARKIDFASLEQLRNAYEPRTTRMLGDDQTAPEKVVTFFDIFDEALQVLRTEEDFCDLAMDFFKRCSERNVHYVEPFFGPHSHRHRGLLPEVFMEAYRKAQLEAETRLNIYCQWIMVINRSKPIEEAWENYNNVALKYKEMIVGIGVAGNEVGRPASLFEDLLRRARDDGFKITVHCDVDVPNTHAHIKQVLTTVSGTGADRCDHGLNIAQSESLIDLVIEKEIGLTLCPWGYVIYSGHPIWQSFRTLHESGVLVTVNSDDPPYMMGNYTEENLVLTKIAGGFTNADLIAFQKNSIKISWAPPKVKRQLSELLVRYENEIGSM